MIFLVGAARLELTAPRSQSECATRLRYIPMLHTNLRDVTVQKKRWSGRWESNPLDVLFPKQAARLWPTSRLVLIPRIELGYTAFRTVAKTTLAQSANLL